MFSIGQSYNQPIFPPNSTWNQNATTFATESQIGTGPYAIYIDTNNSIYTINLTNGGILIWRNDSTDPNIILYTQLAYNSYSLFVTPDDDIYAGSSTSVRKVIKSNSYSNITISVASTSGSCRGIFVDINNTLYCSIITGEHRVVKKWLNDNSSTMTTVAGNGSNGSASNLLNTPYGIFVDTNFDLYVADSNNNRVQLFPLGQTNGITVAGSTSLNITISLNVPTYVILDGNKYLFITDYGNRRIIGSDENGFRSIIAYSTGGPGSNQLSSPRSIAFDSCGNLFVVDKNNNRIQKFFLSTNLCNAGTTTSTSSNINQSKTFKGKIEKEKLFLLKCQCVNLLR